MNQPPKPPQREFWSSWQQNIQPGSFKATLWKGHREPKSLAPRKSVVGLFQTWGQPSRTLKPRDPFIKMVTSWIILTQIHLVIGFGNPNICWSIELSFCWIRSSAKASGFASGTSTLRCELGLETDAFLLRLPFEFCMLWQMKRVEQAFLHQKLTLVDKDLTKWTCYKAWFQWVAISGELTFQKMMSHSQLKNGSPTQTRLEARSNSSGVMIILIKSTVATGPL